MLVSVIAGLMVLYNCNSKYWKFYCVLQAVLTKKKMADLQEAVKQGDNMLSQVVSFRFIFFFKNSYVHIRSISTILLFMLCSHYMFILCSCFTFFIM